MRWEGPERREAASGPGPGTETVGPGTETAPSGGGPSGGRKESELTGSQGGLGQPSLPRASRPFRKNIRKPPATQHLRAEPKCWARGPSCCARVAPGFWCPRWDPSRPALPRSPRAPSHLDSSPVASTPKCSHTAGQNCSRHVMKSSSRLETRGNEPSPREPPAPRSSTATQGCNPRRGAPSGGSVLTGRSLPPRPAGREEGARQKGGRGQGRGPPSFALGDARQEAC